MAEKTETAVLRVINLRCRADSAVDLKHLVARKLEVAVQAVAGVRILRRAADARRRRIDFVYTVAAEISTERGVLERLLQLPDVEPYAEPPVLRRGTPGAIASAPIIVGCGPAGLFAALGLAERGIRPIVVERGSRITKRSVDVDRFWEQGLLDPESNVLFGEGGAGTFSDGKLTTRIKSSLKNKVLQELVEAGAEQDILYIDRPHLGTDRLRRIIPALVEKLQRKGVCFRFDTCVRTIHIEKGRVTGITAGRDRLSTGHLFLACGHSARDVYRVLHHRGVRMECKGFAAGLRIEHPQELINYAQTGLREPTEALGPAAYRLAFTDAAEKRGVYSFCMCPGGRIIGCSNSDGELCTNGMSVYSRQSSWANAAIVAAVRPDDIKGKTVLKALEFQEELERSAYSLGGGSYYAPVQPARDFVSPESRRHPQQHGFCSYRPGTAAADLRELLPEYICGPLQRALKQFDRRIPGFIDEGLLVGVETRTSAPLRILREKKNCQATGVAGLIPIGEGSGYAGGIMSSAVDGYRAAMLFDS